MKKGLGTVGLEMASIVLAIVLGFMVTSWGETREERQRADSAVARMRLEMAANRAGLADMAPYYRRMAITLDSIARADGDVALFSSPVPGWRGVSPPDLRTASFAVATSTGALANVDFDTADAIAAAYEGVDAFSGALTQAMAATMGGNVRTVTQWGLIFALLAEVASGAQEQIEAALQVVGPADSN